MINLRRTIHETLQSYAKKEEWQKLGDYNQLVNGLVLAVSNELATEFHLINEDAARAME